jgi:hypothetical protein
MPVCSKHVTLHQVMWKAYQIAARLFQNRTSGSTFWLTYLPSYYPAEEKIRSYYQGPPKCTEQAENMCMLSRRLCIATDCTCKQWSRTTRFTHHSLRLLFAGGHYQPTYLFNNKPPNHPTDKPTTQPIMDLLANWQPITSSVELNSCLICRIWGSHSGDYEEF